MGGGEETVTLCGVSKTGFGLVGTTCLLFVLDVEGIGLDDALTTFDVVKGLARNGCCLDSVAEELTLRGVKLFDCSLRLAFVFACCCCVLCGFIFDLFEIFDVELVPFISLVLVFFLSSLSAGISWSLVEDLIGLDDEDDFFISEFLVAAVSDRNTFVS